MFTPQKDVDPQQILTPQKLLTPKIFDHPKTFDPPNNNNFFFGGGEGSTRIFWPPLEKNPKNVFSLFFPNFNLLSSLLYPT
jgi:hypothetical protein